jgi:hypothetical protein
MIKIGIIVPKKSGRVSVRVMVGLSICKILSIPTMMPNTRKPNSIVIMDFLGNKSWPI